MDAHPGLFPDGSNIAQEYLFSISIFQEGDHTGANLRRHGFDSGRVELKQRDNRHQQDTKHLKVTELFIISNMCKTWNR